MSILQFSQSLNSDRPVLTDKVHPQLTRGALAGSVGYEIAHGLTAEEEHTAVGEALRHGLSDAAIAGASTPSLESEFQLGRQDDTLDPNLWDNVRDLVQGEVAIAASPFAVPERSGAIEAEALRRQINEYIARSGPKLVEFRDERLAKAA